MGRERTRQRNHVYLCIAVVMCFAVIGCAAGGDIVEPPNETVPAGPDVQRDLADARRDFAAARRRDLAEGRRLLAAGDYQSALRINETVLKTSAGKPPADEALFNIGIIFAHPGNRSRDYQRSIVSFRRLVKEYPQSPLADQATVWAGVLEENIKLRRASSEALQENTRLKQIIEKSKAVDVEIEEKKREETR
ncbi:MAG: hypothetical protein KA801_03375 [Syntrophorhabdaceae bacterium]|nr:hypothetical protein [Syntrophorhabdaceae bacterium]